MESITAVLGRCTRFLGGLSTSDDPADSDASPHLPSTAPPLSTRSLRASVDKAAAEDAPEAPKSSNKGVVEGSGNGSGSGTSGLLGSLILRCHRAPAEKPSVLPAGQNPIRSKKDAQCNFGLNILVQHEAPELAVITELNGHVGHTPGDSEDLQWLPLDSDIAKTAAELLVYNTPAQALYELKRLALAGGLTDSARRAAMSVTLAQLGNLQKRRLAASRVDRNDVNAVALMVEQAGDNILYYHPQEIDADGDVESHLRLAICPKFGRDLLAKCGQKLIFMDGVYGTSKYGFPLLALVVRDEFGHGNPVALCIASAEKAEIWEEFLKAVTEAAGLDLANLTFMIDKSQTEMAAIRNVGAQYLLCHFHMLQEAERFLKSGESGLSGLGNKARRVSVLLQLAQLQKIVDEDVFSVKSSKFKNQLVSTDAEKVKEWYAKNWEACAAVWAGYGRKHVAELKSNTNNLVERFFHSLKYTFCRGRVARRVDALLQTLLCKVFISYICTRATRLEGSDYTKAECLQRRHDLNVAYLADTANAALSIEDESIGHAICNSRSDPKLSYCVVVGDCSCECGANRDDICHHLEAAARRAPLTLCMMRRAAEAIVNRKLIFKMEEDDALLGKELYEVHPLAFPFGKAPAGAICYVNVTDRQCSCHAMKHHGFCSHLLACGSGGDGDGEYELDEALVVSAMSEGINCSDPTFEMEGKTLVVQRTRLLLRGEASGDGSVMNALVEQAAELHALENVTLGAGAADARVMHLTSQLKNISKELSSSGVRALALQLDLLLQEAKQLVPRYTATEIAIQKQQTKALSRQASDLRHRALHPGRSATPAARRNPPRAANATTASGAAPRTFTTTNAPGRVVTTMRGLVNEGLHRSTKKGNKRESRGKRKAEQAIEVVPRGKRVATVGTRAMRRKEAANK